MLKPLDCKHPLEADHAQLYDLLVSQLTDVVVFLMDRDGCIASWNPAVQRMLGYSEDEWLGQSAEILFTPEDRAERRLQEEIVAATRSGESPDLRRHVRKDGTTLFTKGTLVALRDRSGQLLGFSKVMQDVTERVSREEELQDALEYAEDILQSVREPLLVLDRDWRVRSVNRAFCSSFQVPREAIVGQPLLELADGPWSLPQVRVLLEQVTPGEDAIERIELDYVFASLGCRTMLVSARGLPYQDGRAGLTLLGIEDITQRKQTERALAASEKQRRLLMDAAPALIGYVDRDLRYRLANHAYERWFGVAADDLIGRFVSEIFAPATLSAIRPRMAKVLSGETVVFEEEYPGIDGLRTLQMTYTPDRDEQGEIQGFVVLGIDVTARNKAEVALRESEERWRSLFERMVEGFFVGELLFDGAGRATDFRFLEVNPAFRTLTGVANAAGKTAREVAPGIPDELIQAYARVVATGAPEHFETCVPELENAWYEIRARRTEPGRFCVLFLNITERKKADLQFQESERRRTALLALGERLRDLKDMSSLTSAAMEIVGSTLGVARAGYGSVDATQEYVMIENDWTDGRAATITGTYRFEDFGAGLVPHLRRGEPIVIPDVTTHPITARDSERWKALNINSVVNLPLVENGRLSALLFVQAATPRDWNDDDLEFLQRVADRTWAAAERARALEDREKSEAFTRSVLDSSPDCLKVVDLEGRLLTMNEGGCRQMEIDDFAACANQPWVQFWGEGEALALNALAQARAGQTIRFEGFCPTAKGTPKWWEVVVTPIRDSSGEPVRILCLSRDITHRKSAEQERDRLTQELQRSNEDLSLFAHTVAHDLQTPLRGVTTFAQLLQRNAGGRLESKEQQFIGHIIESARHMANLVSGLLHFAQVGQGGIERKPVAMEAVLNSALHALHSQIEEQGAEITRFPLPVVIGDTVQLQQLLQNLIGNAIKYRRHDEPPSIRIEAVLDGDQCVFAVHDNGEGIAPEHLLRIFEPLKRLHGAEIPGTGLGLATCQRIVQRHGGRIWVESQPGLGSTFFFTLSETLPSR